MLNTYNCNSSKSLNINAVSGAILKNHVKSWFEVFDLDGYNACKWLRPDADIVILQMVICGDMKVIAECLYRIDYEIEYNKK